MSNLNCLKYGYDYNYGYGYGYGYGYSYNYGYGYSNHYWPQPQEGTGDIGSHLIMTYSLYSLAYYWQWLLVYALLWLLL